MRKNKILSGFTVLLLALAYAGNSYAEESAVPFVFAEGGQARAAIVTGKSPERGKAIAAGELAKYLNKITGGGFPIVEEALPGWNTILVGTPYRNAKPEEIRIRVKDAKTLEVTGDGPRGTLYAVYDLLETLGVGFWALDFEQIPDKKDLSLAGDYAKIDAPYMEYRAPATEYVYHMKKPGPYFLYAMKLRANSGPGGKNGTPWDDFGGGYQYDNGQNLTMRNGWIDRNKFFKDHPEWYAWNRKKKGRVNSWVCVQSEEMFQELFREIDEVLQKKPYLKSVSISVDDTMYFCECEKCTALIRSDTNPEKAEIPSIQNLVIVNRVAKHFAKKYPSVVFSMLGYASVESCPTSERFALEANAGAMYAQLWRDHARPVFTSEWQNSRFERWANLSRKHGLFIWDYYARYSNYHLPFPNTYIMGPNMRYYKEHGVKGIMAQMQAGNVHDLGDLHAWVFSKLAWNPDLDDRALVRRYLDGAFGNAAKFMQEYLDFLDHARDRERWRWMGCYVNNTEYWLTPEDCIRIMRLFDRAAAAVRGDPDRARQVWKASVAPLMLALYRYNDLILPAKKMNYKLPDRETLFERWKHIAFDSINGYGTMQDAENCSPNDKTRKGTLFRKLMDQETKPTEVPVRTHSSIYISADAMTGGKRMTREKDPDGTPFARFVVSQKEDESIWMNPAFAEAGFTVTPREEGEWIVFATVRTGATVPLDPAAAYAGLYSPFVVSGVTMHPLNELCAMKIAGSPGEDVWKTHCLGKFKLIPGARLWVMPGCVHPIRFTDVKNFILVDPAVLEQSMR